MYPTTGVFDASTISIASNASKRRVTASHKYAYFQSGLLVLWWSINLCTKQGEMPHSTSASLRCTALRYSRLIAPKGRN